MLFIGGIILGSILYNRAKSKNKSKISNDQKKLPKRDVSSETDTLAAITTAPTVPPIVKGNMELSIATTSLGFVLLGQFLFSPFMLLGVGGLAYLIWPIWKKAYYDIIKRKRFTRMVLEAIVLPCTLLAGKFLAAALAYWMLYLALHIISRAKTNTNNNLNSVFVSSSHRIVYVLREGIEVELTLGEIQKGDVLVIVAGEIIPVDGVIVQGEAGIDQHMLTGESQSVEKQIGDSVFAATLILSGRIEVEVIKEGDATIAEQTSQVLEKMTTFTDTLELRSIDNADRIALPYFVLGTATSFFKGASAGLGIFWSPLDDALYTAGPLSVLNYLNIALKRGILIKDGRSLEMLRNVDTFVFDKTGTLTHGIPHVVDIHTFADIDSLDILTYAAAAEYKQVHPIALAILKAASDKNLILPKIKPITYQTGYGLTVLMGEQTLQVGSQRFMHQQSCTFSKRCEEMQVKADECGYSLVYIACDKKLIGAIELHTGLRQDAIVTIQKLQTLGYNIAIISGDHEKATQHLAQQLGIDTYFSETLPTDKAKLLKVMQEEGRVVCYVGDGVNDTIALKQAEVSISLQGASTIATDTAQIILMDETLEQIIDLIKLSERLKSTYRNIIISSTVPTLGIIGGVLLFNMGLSMAIIAYMLGMGFSVGSAMLPVVKEYYLPSDTKKLLSKPKPSDDKV